MMKKIRIPRRDHEVYFFPVPEAFKSKLIRSFVVKQMERLHPGFSGESALDIKRLVLNKTRWVMATVMEAETLEEYRILNKGAVFFTNTSIMVNKKDFTSGGIQTVGDECIGYDSETPFSIPLESGSTESGKTDSFESPVKAVKTVPSRCRVFTGRIPAWRVTTMMACAALLAFIPLFIFPAAKEAGETLGVPFVVKVAEPSQKPKYPPPAIEILSDFSADFVLTGGKITRWQYSESYNNEDRYNEALPHMIIETRGIDAISLHRIFNQYEYVVLEDIPVIRYINGEPYLTVFLNSVSKGYAAPRIGTFFSQGFSLPIFVDLMNELKRHEISVVSETLPSTENGNVLYTVTYTAKDRAFIRSMEIITGICDKYPVRVKGMDISIGGESDIFTVVCSLAQSDTPRYVTNGLGDKKAKIPSAFGYKETPPPPPPPKAVVAQSQATQPQEAPQTPQTREPAPEVSVVGTIRGDRGQLLFYREAGNSKIIIKDTP